ncbi:MAG: desulfoferrodoxin Dfx [Firmicutes bacterium]|nr:desulfoferrodoxin Dfx [Candidatus Colivicinus equi]
MINMKIYRCNICGNMFVVIDDRKVVPKCCDQDMEILSANETDGAIEKHVPKVTRNENEIYVEVGELPHPMVPEHYIMMIALETDRGVYIRYLTSSDSPTAMFKIGNNETPIKVYEYCNVHSLYSKDLNNNEE